MRRRWKYTPGPDDAPGPFRPSWHPGHAPGSRERASRPHPRPHRPRPETNFPPLRRADISPVHGALGPVRAVALRAPGSGRLGPLRARPRIMRNSSLAHVAVVFRPPLLVAPAAAAPLAPDGSRGARCRSDGRRDRCHCTPIRRLLGRPRRRASVAGIGLRPKPAGVRDEGEELKFNAAVQRVHARGAGCCGSRTDGVATDGAGSRAADGDSPQPGCLVSPGGCSVIATDSAARPGAVQGGCRDATRSAAVRRGSWASPATPEGVWRGGGVGWGGEIISWDGKEVGAGERSLTSDTGELHVDHEGKKWLERRRRTGSNRETGCVATTGGTEEHSPFYLRARDRATHTHHTVRLPRIMPAGDRRLTSAH